MAAWLQFYNRDIRRRSVCAPRIDKLSYLQRNQSIMFFHLGDNFFGNFALKRLSILAAQFGAMNSLNRLALNAPCHQRAVIFKEDFLLLSHFPALFLLARLQPKYCHDKAFFRQLNRRRHFSWAKFPIFSRHIPSLLRFLVRQQQNAYK